jgi:CheY-like chemotaxis protein
MPKARVLAVDDQLYFRVFLEDVLSQGGHEVTTVSSVDEAMQALGRAEFDAVVADLAMPGQDPMAWVARLRAAAPRSELVVAASPGDMHAAADALSAGATEYVQKPLDARILLRTLSGAFERRRNAVEREDLVAENLDYLGTFSLYERALALYAQRDRHVLADRIVEGLCIESSAQSGLLWLADPARGEALVLCGVRGLVRSEEYPGEISGTFELAEEDQLQVPLYHGDAVVGVALLSDPVDNALFRAEGAGGARRFAALASGAVANALAFARAGGPGLHDPQTETYSAAYVEDAARNELEKAQRFGRHFCVMRVNIAGAAEDAALLRQVAHLVSEALRATDLVGTDAAGHLTLLLPETHGLGAGILKRRIRTVLDGALRHRADGETPLTTLAHAAFPGDGRSFDQLLAALVRNSEQDRTSALHSARAADRSFDDLLEYFVETANDTRCETAEELAQFVFRERARVPGRRGLLMTAPNAAISGAVFRGVEELRGISLEGDVVVLVDPADPRTTGVPVTWVPRDKITTRRSFLLYHSEGPSYGLVFDEREGGGVYHSTDRSFVEHLCFELGRELDLQVAE